MTNDQGTNANLKGKQGRAAAALCLLALSLAIGCSRQDADSAQPENKSATPTSTEATPAGGNNATNLSGQQVFEVRGVVQEVRAGEGEVVIKHEEIPNYMPAMTMPFDVKNTNELAGLARNDEVSFRMIVTDEDGWIENIKKTGVAAAEPEPRPTTRLVREVDPLEVGDKMPNYPFTNSLGQKIELKDFAGQAYAFTFIFTRCPFPTYCPRMNSNFEKTYQQLLSMPNAPTNWHLFSISFDPEFDTPARLKEYSSTYNPNPEKWSWVTGAMIEIDAITEQFGLYFARDQSTINHNLRTVVVDKNGIIRHIIIGNEWSTEELVREIVAGAQGKPIGEY